MDWNRELDILSDSAFDEPETDAWEYRYAALKKSASDPALSEIAKLRIFREALNDSEPPIRYCAVMEINALGCEGVVEALIYAMSDSYEWVRIRAIEGLGHRRAKPAIEVFIKYLEGEQDLKVRATLVKHLGSFCEERLIPIISNYLTDSDARVRANAIEGLGFFPKEDVLHILKPFADDENVRIRANVAVILSKFGVSMGQETLDRMSFSSDPLEKTGAVYSMGEIRKEEYIPILLQSLSDSSFLVQKNAQDALKKYGLRVQGVLLKEIRNSDDPVFVQGAIKVLGTIGDRKALKTLFKMREIRDGDVRSAAEEAIDEIELRMC